MRQTISQTHTYAILEVPSDVYESIAWRLREAGYIHVFMQDGEIDMHGIAIQKEPVTIMINTDKSDRKD